MKKKVVSLLLVTTMVASLAAGCGDSSSSGDGTEKTGKKVETVDDGHTLTAWAYHDVQTEFEKLPSRYNGGGTN